MRALKGILGDREFNQKLRKLTIPIALQSLLMNAVSLGDTFILGAVSQEALAAVSLASQVFFVLSLFMFTLIGGTTILAAQYLGKKDHRTVQFTYSMSLRYTVLISLVFFALSVFAPRWLMTLFTTEEEMIVIGVEYLRISGFSYLFAGISQCYLCMMKLGDRAKSGTIITTVIVFLDLILNVIFVFGLLGLPKMGAKGAALTTVISKAIEMVIVIIYSCVGDQIKPTWKGLVVIKPKLEKEFWYYTYPVLLNAIAWGGGMTLYSVVMGHLGTNATAAYSIVTTIKNLIICFSTGMGNAGSILLGKELGENNLERSKLYGQRLSVLSVLFGLVTGVAAMIVGPLIVLLFKVDSATSALFLPMLVWCAINCVGRCINGTVIDGIFMAGGDTKFDFQSLFVTMWGIILPLVFCAAFWWKLPVIWVYFIISMDEIIKLPWVYANYKKYKWLKNITKDNLT